jgi:hypothetical protein
VIMLVLYDTDDLGIFAQTRIEFGFGQPVMKNFNILPLNVRTVPVRKRQQVIRGCIDKTDFIAFGVGTYTFMRHWAHFAMIYGFTKNRPMLAGSSVNIRDGWSQEITAGPSPFTRPKWEIVGPNIRLYTLDPVFEVVWQFRRSIPQDSVRYRLEGKTGLFEEIAPMYDWVYDNPNANAFAWVEKSIWLAGL